jgi:glucose-6-phosphate 1-dehydrogenase
VGVEDRARYYDKAGALRDMIQNHLTQLLTLTGMEVPSAFEANAIRDEKVKVLKSIGPPDPEQVVFGQYGAGDIGEESVQGYLDESNVASDSKTETFVAMRLDIDNWRWQGVPFFLRTGKRMPERLSQIVVKFRQPPIALFRDEEACDLNSNTLVLTLQPREGFDLHFDVKTPGQDIAVRTQQLHFEYAEAFGHIPDGYETLLFDIVTNDQTLFVRSDEVEAAWSLYSGLLEEDIRVHEYEAGSWGPEASDELLDRSGHEWAVVQTT